MKTYSIKITGDGTTAQIEHSLRDLLRAIRDAESEKNSNPTILFEDAVIYAEIIEK